MLEKIIRDFMTIWTTVDPISNLALFAGLTAAMHRSERRRAAWRASLYAVKCTGFWLFSSSRDNDKILRIVAIMCATVPRSPKSSRQDSAMVTSSILSPSDCTPQALADFESLVSKYGTVDPQGLTKRIRDAFRLLFLRESNGQLVGVGALKRPQLGYRSKVFAKARATTPPDEYRVELGWVAVAKSHQGQGLSRRIIGQLISLAENENLFATTRADARAMRFAVDYGFKPAGKPYPSGHGYDLVLYIRNAEETKQAVLSDRQTPS